MLAAMTLLASTTPIAFGSSMKTIDFEGTKLELYLYRPAKVRRLIMVMHGTLRNADDYRDHAMSMGDRFEALVVAPKFDSARFPSVRYQRGGIVRADGTAAKPEEWTYAYIPKIADRVTSALGNRPPLWIIGHSAGGQFVVRMAAFQKTGAERLVAANAGSHLFPRLDAPFGYGFAGLPPELANDDRLRTFLAAPLTLYQGTGDNRPDEYFDESAEAMKQGAGRWQRAKSAFAFANELAAKKGWKFNWKLVEAKGVAHDHEKMFNHPQCAVALFGMSEAALKRIDD